MNTVFFINLLAGISLSLLFYFLAPSIAVFFDKPILTILTRSLSPIFVISALSGVNRALTIKNLNFKLNTIIALVSLLISSSVAILLAFKGFGVWSILFKMILSQSIITFLYLIFTPLNQKPVFDKNSFKSLFKIGSYIAGDTVINYWSRNIDNLLIGKFLGDSSLGIYTKAYAVMLLPLRNISRVIGRVMFPSFSKLQNNRVQIKNIYLKATKIIAFITFPLMGILALSAEPFVLVAFGEDWLEMSPIISWLSLLGASQSILTLNGPIYNSLGKANIAFKISIAMSIINIIGFIVGLKLGGLLGLVIAYTCLGVITAVPNFYFAGKQIQVSVTEMMINLANSFLGTLIMVGLIYLLKSTILERPLPPLLQLLCIGFMGITIFLSLAYVLRFEELRIAKDVFFTRKTLKNN